MGKLTALICTLVVLLISLPATAQDSTYVSSYGDEYSVEINANGAVLRSLYPKAWFIDRGAASRIERGIDTIYFGVSCDAFHAVFGNGTWSWANGGFWAEFENVSIRFPRQELDIAGLGCAA